MLQHKLNSRHRISIDLHLFQLDPSMSTLIPNIDKPVSRFDNHVPRLSLRVRHIRRNINPIKPNEALRMPKHAPLLAFLPRQDLRRIVLVTASERGVLVCQGFDSSFHTREARAIAVLHAEVGRVLGGTGCWRSNYLCG
jgi:hypothetical protein